MSQIKNNLGFSILARPLNLTPPSGTTRWRLSYSAISLLNQDLTFLYCWDTSCTLTALLHYCTGPLDMANIQDQLDMFLLDIELNFIFRFNNVKIEFLEIHSKGLESKALVIVYIREDSMISDVTGRRPLPVRNHMVSIEGGPKL